MKKLLIAAAIAGLAGTVNAQSAFEGGYVQLGIGYENSSSGFKSGTVTAGSSIGQTLTSSGGGASSFSSGVGLGYYFGLTKSFLLGIGADYSPLPSSRTTSTLYVDGVQQDSNALSKTSSYSFFVSPALAIDKEKLAYAKLGYNSSSIKGTSGADSTSYTSNFNGYLFGLGYKQIINGGLYGFAEGNYMSYGNKTFTDEFGPYQVKANSMNLLVGVGYKF